ncbi:2-keto-4-pentenoate hydratase [Xylophilus sp.]|uniref:2-keto-4-pentenoate hydratase n=1 Tax=Xylophilus sp. TaxID=2653893 RepID=UPI0013BBD9E2|nr:fumarylacetoacetate hydrolase [Xylophilus sp.]KAF1048714.1 MAG: 2-oxopent-4-enoate hydratase [Xylophilus sp.]
MPLFRRLPSAAVAVVAFLGAAAATAECLSDAQVAVLASSYEARTPAPTPAGLSEADAACTRDKFNAWLAQRHGKVIGYKAGLTSTAVQQRFHYDKPVWGKLYQGMVLANGATVDAAFGARPLFEADLLVRVRDARINSARTPAEVLASIDRIIPFIEMPDLVVESPLQLDGPGVAAINVGARLGVAGAPIAIPKLRAERYALLDALRDMAVVVSDGSGATLAQGRGSDILGHPLNAVIWIADALQRENLALQPGDVVSLGSFSPLMPPRPGQSISVRYDGLPGAAPVRASFR